MKKLLTQWCFIVTVDINPESDKQILNLRTSPGVYLEGSRKFSVQTSLIRSSVVCTAEQNVKCFTE
jgi:hypothetical protein